MTDDPRGLEEPEAFDEDDLEDEELDEDEREDERAAERVAPAAPGHRGGRGAGTGMGGPRRGGPATTVRATRSRGFAIDPSLRIRDRVSEAFVIGTLAVFGAILVGALAFGHGGAFTVVPTPAPTVNVTPAPSGSVSPSGSVGPSVSPEVSPSAVPSTGASPAPS